MKTTWFKRTKNSLIYEIWANDRNVFFSGAFASTFREQANSEGIELKNHTVCLINCCNEGIGPLEIKLVLDSLYKANINLDFRVLFNAHVTKELPYKYECFVDHFSAHCGFVGHIRNLDVDWQNLTITKFFISLNRRASVGRVKLAKQLLDRFPHDKFLLSCGSQPNPWIKELPNLNKEIAPYELPILLDGETSGMIEQHYHTDTNFFACFFNVITETSSQTDDDSWHEVFITEKSLKAFAYRQIPIWWAVPGTVQLIRDIGFDVYDDVIDHRYDTEQDPEERLIKMLTTLTDFINIYGLDGMKEWRRGLWTRINKNVDLLYKLNAEHPEKMHNLISRLIK